jgi:integrase
MSTPEPRNQAIKPIQEGNDTTHNQAQVTVPRLSHDCPKKTRGGNSAWPKTDYRHWLPRMEMREGRAYFETRFCMSGKIRRHSFQTRSREDAAKQAAALWKDIEKSGWETAFNKVRPPVAAKAGTVGALITAALTLSTARAQSLDTYAKAFRRIVAGVSGIEDSAKFRDAGRSYRERVDAVRLDSITPAAVKAWRNQYLRAAGGDATARNRAVITTNSLIRNAKALFGKKILPDIRASVVLPAVLPLDGVTLETPPSLRYKSKVDARLILANAREQLAEKDAEAFKLLLLTLVCGLRRSEADLLLWSAFDFAKRTLTLADTEFHRLKSADSAGDIDLDPETAAIFQGYRAKAPAALFVLDGPPHAPRARTRAYRAEMTQQRLMTWLRSQGVTDVRPLHVMRKEIGSIVATEHGLFAAQRYLRHSTPTITAQIYADVKKPITAGLGSLLASAEQTISFTPAEVTAAEPKPLKRKVTAAGHR